MEEGDPKLAFDIATQIAAGPDSDWIENIAAALNLDPNCFVEIEALAAEGVEEALIMRRIRDGEIRIY